MKWSIEQYKIVVECDCGAYYEIGKRDLEDCVHLTCKHCGRVISAHIGIEISSPETSVYFSKESKE